MYPFDPPKLDDIPRPAQVVIASEYVNRKPYTYEEFQWLGDVNWSWTLVITPWWIHGSAINTAFVDTHVRSVDSAHFYPPDAVQTDPWFQVHTLPDERISWDRDY